jgi:hypothetical protein
MHTNNTPTEENMALTDAKNSSDLKEEFGKIDEYIDQEDKQLKYRFMGWITSASLHVAAILIMGLAVVSQVVKEVETPPVKVVYMEPTPEVKLNPTKNYDLIDKKVIIETEEISDTNKVTVPSDFDIVIEQDLQSEDNAKTDGKHGREEAISEYEVGGEGTFLTMGAGGGGGGIYGKRNEWGKTRQASKFYGPNGREALSTLDAALRWIKKHQSPNGSWAEKYELNCQDASKCEPGKFGLGGSDCGVAYTSYAVLCYLGAGYDHKTPNKYKVVVSRGIEYLLSIQKADGQIGNRNYEIAIAAMALSEAYAMTNDTALKEPTQKLIDVVVARQIKGNVEKDPYDVQGWDYTKPTARNDISVTGWNVMAIKSALAAGLNTGHAMEGSKKFIEKVWKATNPNWEKLDNYGKSVFPYTYNSTTSEVAKDHLSFAGACMAVFSGYTSESLMLQTMMNDVDERWLKNDKYKNNLYSVYYSSLASFQCGEERYKPWATAYVPWLINIQYHDETCFDGSFKFPNQSYHGGDDNRLLNHMYATLSLEVAFRYDQVNNLAHKKIK